MEELPPLILNLYRAAQECAIDAFQERALDLLKDVLPFDSCRWGMALTFADDRLTLERAHLHNEMDGAMDAYREVIGQDMIGLEAARNPGRTINVNARHLCADEKDHAAYLAYLCRFRHENLLVTGVVSASNAARSLSYYRADRDDPFSERERQLSELVFPHMMEALTINLRLGLARAQAACGPGRWPMAMCDCNGLILYAEPEFSELLAAQWPAANPSRLPAALVDALIAQGHVCHATDNVFVGVVERHATVVYLKARPRHAVDALSPRELQVARLVAKGMNFKEIAIALQLSPATVRNHIQRIHDRLDIRSNTELASQLAVALP
jgi:DNA-binding CsgD family transcriptional regulator